MDIYEHPEIWDPIAELFGGDELFAEAAQRLGGPVLELASGTGRLIGRIGDGVERQGLDLSPQMVAYAAAKYDDVHFSVGDMTDFDLGQRFGLIFIANNSILHLSDPQDWVRCFRAAGAHLSETGELIVSRVNVRPGFPSSNPEPEEAMRYLDPASGEEVVISQVFDYDSSTRIGQTVWTHHTADGAETISYDFALFYPTNAEVVHWAEEADLTEVGRYGSLAADPWDEDSPVTVQRFAHR